MKNIILILLTCLCSHSSFAQIDISSKNKSLNQLKAALPVLPKSLNFSQQIEIFTQQALIKNKKSIFENNQKKIPSVYAFKDLAFFCKIEVHLEKAMKMPIKFRLGSVDYVDYLEGKRDSY